MRRRLRRAPEVPRGASFRAVQASPRARGSPCACAPRLAPPAGRPPPGPGACPGGCRASAGLTVRGSYLGPRRHVEEVSRLAEQGVVRTHTETHALAETPELLEKMRRGELLGRAVVSCA